MRIRLLGEVGAFTDRGEPLDTGPAKCQAVLAALALSAGTAVPVWRLVDVVWGDDPPRTADRTLQSYLTRLRKGLGPGSIARSGAAYRLDVTADSVDVLRFQRQLDAGDIDAALAEWTGLPLTGLAVPGLAATVDGLVERWLGAVEASLARRAETDAAGAVGPLTELTASYPFREGLWALLMTALYRSGRQADALAAYRTARQNLAGHLGVEPGPRLRELEALVLDHDERLATGQPPAGQGAGRPVTGPAAGRPTGTVTFGFSEVVDSARWWATHPREAAEAMSRHDALVGSVTSRHGGYVFATGGDSFGVAFHRAADAVSWAAALQSGISGQRWPGDAGIRLRIGLHTGEAAERDRGYFGPAVNVAARLAAAGHGGQTLVSGATAAVLDGDGLCDLGRYRLDGVVTEHHIYQLGEDEYPPLRTEDGTQGNLPRRLGRLIGRDDDLKIIGDALVTSPVVTLVGPGGIGKTRLALAAARRVMADDGAWLIDLAEIGSPGDVPRAVASPLGVKESQGRPLAESIVAALRSRELLLVLDNCEHVIDGVAGLAQAIAEGCPDVQVLATSREGLGLDHGLERLIAVAPLEPSGPGAELFSERASAVSATFDCAASRQDVAEICRRLDGVPLAIELAAARTASLTPADLLRRLDDHLRLLVGGRRASAERHRTLRATIGWSYDLLSPPEQMLLGRLSIFVGPFDLAAAETVAADGAPGVADVAPGAAGGAPGVADGALGTADGAPGAVDGALGVADVGDLLRDLVARSMLVAESGPFGQRFRLLETIRQFAAERLAQAGDTDALARRQARWCAGRAAHIQRLLAGPAEIEGATRLDELWPNHRAAFEWAGASDDRDLAYALVRPIVVEILRRSRGELGDWVERILAMTTPGDTELVVFGLTWAAQRYKLSQDPDAWERLAARYGEPDNPLIRHARASVYQDWAALGAAAPAAMAELRQRGENDLAEQFELDVAAPLVFAGQFEQGDALIASLADRYRRHGPPTLLHLSLMLLGYSATLQGKHDRAEQLFSEAVAVEVPERTQSPNRSLEARALFRRGDRARAFRILGSFIEELLDTGNIQAICVTCVEFVNMMAALDRLADAAAMLHHLDRTAPYWATLVAGAREKIDSGLTLPPGQASDLSLDDRQALEYMRRVLRQLASGQPAG